MSKKARRAKTTDAGGEKLFRTSVLMTEGQKLELEEARLQLRRRGISVSVSQLIRQAIDRQIHAHKESEKRAQLGVRGVTRG